MNAYVNNSRGYIHPCSKSCYPDTLGEIIIEKEGRR
jgi:hypothetical protein